MTWLEIVVIVVLLMGIGAGGYLVAQRPAFWAGLGAVLIKAGWPYILKCVSARMTPEQEKEFHECFRRNGEWDNVRKKCRD